MSFNNNIITVKNAEGEPDTTAEIVVQKYNIAMISDEGYIMPTIVALTSLDKNACNNIYDVHILINSISEENTKLFKNQNFKNISVYLIDVTDIIKKFRDTIQCRHVPYTALLKFYLPQVFPQLDKILYIDGDILIQKDLQDLFDIDITDYYSAAVRDTLDILNLSHKKKIGMSDGIYFNSGIMLLNLKKMRKNNITEKLIEYKLHHWQHFMDQDAFNVIFENQVEYISYKYNFLNYCLTVMNKSQLSDMFNENISIFQTDEELYRNCVIIHFGGKEKPWIYNMGYLSRLYEKYYNETTFAKNKLQLKYLNVLPSPKVSVIMPCYNTAPFLRQALDSVVNQTLKDIEIICVNDGSTDNSLQILEEYAQRDNRVKIYSQNNKGSAAARNYGICKASGEYIGFIDADDYINNEYFEKLYEAAQSQRADISATDGVILVNTQNQTVKPVGIPATAKVLVTILEKADIILTTGVSFNKIYKKRFLEKYSINCCEIKNAAEDNYFTDLSVICANKIAVSHSSFYYYCIHPNSQTQALKTDKDFAVFDIYELIEQQIQKLDISENEKYQWLNIINARKLRDFKVFLNTMDNRYIDSFAKETIKHRYPLIISLTSYPARINTVNQAIESLLNQSMKADKVILWLAPEQFPNGEKDLPKQLLDLKAKGLTIDWYHDIKSYKKLIPALKKYPEAIIVTADDDALYSPNWLERLYSAYIKYPYYIHCHRAHKVVIKNKQIAAYKDWVWFNKVKPGQSSYNIFLTGVGGVLYPPHCLHEDVLDEQKFLSFSPEGDDLWFWAMALRQHTKINIVENALLTPKIIDDTQESALWRTNVSGNQNDIQLQNIIKAYPEILNLLCGESINHFLLLFKDIGLGCNTWCEPKTANGYSYTYDLSDNIYTRYVSWDPIKEGSCDVEIMRLSAVEKRSKKVVDFPVNKIVSSGKISGNKVAFRNQKGCWIGCTIEGAYESFTVEAKVTNV